MAPLSCCEDPVTQSKSPKPRKSQDKNRKSRKKVRSPKRRPTLQNLKRQPPASAKAIAPTGKHRPESKQAQVIAMLQMPTGTTIGAIMQITGWQPHSVRGFLAAVVRKKLGLDLTSEANAGERVYRIVERTMQKTNTAV